MQGQRCVWGVYFRTVAEMRQQALPPSQPLPSYLQRPVAASPFAGTPSGKGRVEGRFLLCHLCGRPFGSASLPIHVKQCAEKISVHQQQAQVRPTLNPSRPANRPSTSPATDLDASRMLEAYQRVRAGEMTMVEFNSLSSQNYVDKVVERGLKMECDSCHRTFVRPEGLEKHRILCEKSNSSYVRKSQGPVHTQTSTTKPTTAAPVTKERAEPVEYAVARPTESRSQVTSNAQTDPSPSPMSDPVFPKANYCVQCGLDFGAIPWVVSKSNPTTWRFCPQCGQERVGL